MYKYYCTKPTTDVNWGNLYNKGSKTSPKITKINTNSPTYCTQTHFPVFQGTKAAASSSQQPPVREAVGSHEGLGQHGGRAGEDHNVGLGEGERLVGHHRQLWVVEVGVLEAREVLRPWRTGGWGGGGGGRPSGIHDLELYGTTNAPREDRVNKSSRLRRQLQGRGVLWWTFQHDKSAGTHLRLKPPRATMAWGGGGKITKTNGTPQL